MGICVGIAGGSASGKSTLAQALATRLAGEVSVIEHDWYYRDQRHLAFEKRLKANYDHPDALETALLVEHLQRLLAGEAVHAPQYDFTQHTRAAETHLVEPGPVLVVAGIHALGDAALRDCMALKVYVDTDADLRFIRRLRRDTAERGRTAESVIRQYLEQVRPMHVRFVAPTKAHADLVVSGEDLGDADAELVAGAVRAKLGAAPHSEH